MTLQHTLATALSTGPSDPDWAVEGIPVENIDYVWDDAWPYLKRAVDRFPDLPNKYTEAIVLSRLHRKHMQLWIGYDFKADRICGALVTEIITDKRVEDGPLCSIPLVGGDDFMKWGDAIWTTLKTWAAHQGCVAMVGYGRRGWQRLYGFIECGKMEDGTPIMIRRLKRG